MFYCSKQERVLRQWGSQSDSQSNKGSLANITPTDRKITEQIRQYFLFYTALWDWTVTKNNTAFLSAQGPPALLSLSGSKSRAVCQHQQVLPWVQEVTPESHAKLTCLQPAAFITHSNSLFIGLDNVIVEILVVFDHIQWDDKIHIHIRIAQLVESDVHCEEVIPHIFNPWLQAFAYHIPDEQGREVNSFTQPTCLLHSHYTESFPNPRSSFLLNIFIKMQTDLSPSHCTFSKLWKSREMQPCVNSPYISLKE